MTAPHLDTPRLTLRPHRVADFDEYAAMWGDPEVVRYIGGQPSSRQESWARLLRQAGLWPVLGFGYWIVRERESGRLVGEVGFANLERDMDPPLGDMPEAGWVLASWAHGVGYATEAMTAALQWSDEHLGRSVVCIIDPGNGPSIRLATKCGFKELHRSSFLGEPTIVFERAASS